MTNSNISTVECQSVLFLIRNAAIGMTLFIISPLINLSNDEPSLPIREGLTLRYRLLKKNSNRSVGLQTINVYFLDRQKFLMLTFFFFCFAMYFFFIPSSFAQGITLTERKCRQFESHLYPENITFFTTSLRNEVIKRKLNSMDTGSLYQWMPTKFFSDELIIQWAKDINSKITLKKGIYVNSLCGNTDQGFTFTKINRTNVSPITQVCLAMCTLRIFYYILHQKPLYFRY
jgi:hypothetical protein